MSGSLSAHEAWARVLSLLEVCDPRRKPSERVIETLFADVAGDPSFTPALGRRLLAPLAKTDIALASRLAYGHGVLKSVAKKK